MTGKEVEEFSEFAKKAMEQGQRDEPYIRQVFSEVMKLPVAECGIFEHPYAPTAASPDGLVYDGSKCRHSVLEIKRPARALYDEIPLHYWVQVQMQLVCTGLAHAYFICWMPSRGHKLWTIDYSNEFAEWSAQSLIEFEKWIRTDTPPPKVKLAPIRHRWERVRNETSKLISFEHGWSGA